MTNRKWEIELGYQWIEAMFVRYLVSDQTWSTIVTKICEWCSDWHIQFLYHWLASLLRQTSLHMIWPSKQERNDASHLRLIQHNFTLKTTDAFRPSLSMSTSHVLVFGCEDFKSFTLVIPSLRHHGLTCCFKCDNDGAVPVPLLSTLLRSNLYWHWSSKQ